MIVTFSVDGVCSLFIVYFVFQAAFVKQALDTHNIKYMLVMQQIS